ncbi:hypothetical protein ACSDR0_24590 [Streptosporangium sp. G11]|uniref:hypothetical protein n=1 Tax=Streptosporangium sp. G11 TaxID=3436926 RepID=UPI003EBB44B4
MSEYQHAALVREIISGFPPLTTEQKARISILLGSAVPAASDELASTSDAA